MSTTPLEILQHSLGVDRYGRGKQYRSYFVAGPGHDNFEQCRTMVREGLMEEHPPSELTGGDYCFTVTLAGRRFVAEFSPAPPKLTRSQQRYEDWLTEGCGMRFGDWLKARTERRAA